MTESATTEQTEHSMANARGWYQSILDMLARLDEAEEGQIECGQCLGTGTIEGGLSGEDDDEECPVCDGSGMIDSEYDEDGVRQEIQESVLSVAVRSGWYSPGSIEDAEPVEYEVLLTTGGPALRITGELGPHGAPESAELQVQDWFKPWTRARVAEDQDEVLLRFVSHFWFGD